MREEKTQKPKPLRSSFRKLPRREMLEKRRLFQRSREATDLSAMRGRINAQRVMMGMPIMREPVEKYPPAKLREIRAEPVNFLGEKRR